MAKPMSKSEMVAALADKIGISKKQVNEFFLAQAELAYKQAKNSFVIPGIGKLVMAERPAQDAYALRSQGRSDDHCSEEEGCQVPRQQGRQGCYSGQEISGTGLAHLTWQEAENWSESL